MTSNGNPKPARPIHYILDEYGDPVPEYDVIKWAMWFEQAGKDRVVAYTPIDGNEVVSTVFLGLDHSFSGGPPILYETMVFENDVQKDDFDHNQRRYHTREEAIEGHNEIVRLLLEIRCSYCGTKIAEATIKCPHCGSTL